MTPFELSHNTPAAHGQSLPVRLARSLASAIAHRWAERRAIAELRELDNHMLRDMGVSRSEIGAAVRGELDRR
jgi:uncharacterized protein YjiS (DUF1127 family)